MSGRTRPPSLPKSVDVHHLEASTSLASGRETGGRSHPRVITPSTPIQFFRRAFSPKRSSRRVEFNETTTRVVRNASSSTTTSSSHSRRLGITQSSYFVVDKEDTPLALPLIRSSSAKNEDIIVNVHVIKPLEETEIVFEPDNPEADASENTLFANAWDDFASACSSLSPRKRSKETPTAGAALIESPLRTIHAPTAKGQYLMNDATTTRGAVAASSSSSLLPGLKYDLNKGRHSMDADMKSKSRQHAKKVRVNESHVIDAAPINVPIIQAGGHKIFLLLLEPNAKIFELIQLLYNPENTRIGDIVDMIPKNATEPALGQQSYAGITRPKRSCKAWTDFGLLASSHDDKVKTSAQIVQGEILVAVPHGYMSRTVVKLAKQILANERIQKLLQKSDPLALKRRSRKRSSFRRSLSPRGRRGSKKLPSMETVEEKSLDETASLQRGLAQAKRDNNNAAASVTSTTSHMEDEDFSFSDNNNNHEAARLVAAPVVTPLSRARSVDQVVSWTAPPRNADDASAVSPLRRATSLSSSTVDHPQHHVKGTFVEDGSTMASSYSSWSRSLDQSLSSRRHKLQLERQSSSSSSTAPRNRRHQRRRLKLITNLKRCALALTSFMLVSYFIDPQGYAKSKAAVQAQSPLGMFGVIQFMLAWMVLIKIQRFLEETPPSATTANDSSQPAGPRSPLWQASNAALERLRDHHRRDQAPVS